MVHCDYMCVWTPVCKTTLDKDYNVRSMVCCFSLVWGFFSPWCFWWLLGFFVCLSFLFVCLFVSLCVLVFSFVFFFFFFFLTHGPLSPGCPPSFKRILVNLPFFQKKILWDSNFLKKISLLKGWLTLEKLSPAHVFCWLQIAVNNWDSEYSGFGLVLYYLLRIEQKRKRRTDSATSATPITVIWKELAVGWGRLV